MLGRIKKKLTNKKGFTMVELIIVIVIIIILAAAIVPNVFKYVNTASKATAKNNAATVLSQVQADLAWDMSVEAAGMEASEATGALAAANTNAGVITGDENTTYHLDMVPDGDSFKATIDEDNVIIKFEYTSGEKIKWTYEVGTWIYTDLTKPTGTQPQE